MDLAQSTSLKPVLRTLCKVCQNPTCQSVFLRLTIHINQSIFCLMEVANQSTAQKSGSLLVNRISTTLSLNLCMSHDSTTLSLGMRTRQPTQIKLCSGSRVAICRDILMLREPQFRDHLTKTLGLIDKIFSNLFLNFNNDRKNL